MKVRFTKKKKPTKKNFVVSKILSYQPGIKIGISPMKLCKQIRPNKDDVQLGEQAKATTAPFL